MCHRDVIKEINYIYSSVREEVHKNHINSYFPQNGTRDSLMRTDYMQFVGMWKSFYSLCQSRIKIIGKYEVYEHKGETKLRVPTLNLFDVMGLPSVHRVWWENTPVEVRKQIIKLGLARRVQGFKYPMPFPEIYEEMGAKYFKQMGDI